MLAELLSMLWRRLNAALLFRSALLFSCYVNYRKQLVLQTFQLIAIKKDKNSCTLDHLSCTFNFNTFLYFMLVMLLLRNYEGPNIKFELL